MPEDALAQAERHVHEAEQHVIHLVRIIRQLEHRPEHDAAAAMARKLLSTLQKSLELALEHTDRIRRERGLAP